ncbi:uncharacterized protein LOC129588185 isoform X2 [Paramacrobiotus metropolitanus]|uniref:uncharacterized protein LOC129588185 isoform X2 n=1 Tax=Paramacrobiotus metropolitanus TaxID=2943436 RepID=UPI0024456122|nr:uncharacterized protein LOC129588185 isoform X2 [Paramacrobiotus metropolitanus]
MAELPYNYKCKAAGCACSIPSRDEIDLSFATQGNTKCRCDHYVGIHHLINNVEPQVNQMVVSLAGRSDNQREAGGIQNVTGSVGQLSTAAAVIPSGNAALPLSGGPYRTVQPGFGTTGMQRPGMVHQPQVQRGLSIGEISSGVQGFPGNRPGGFSGGVQGLPGHRPGGIGYPHAASSPPMPRPARGGRARGSLPKRQCMDSFRSPAGGQSASMGGQLASGDIMEIPRMNWKLYVKVYCFRLLEGNVIPNKRMREDQAEIDFMKHAGLIKQVVFEELSGVHIAAKISQEFCAELRGRNWTLLTRVFVNGKFDGHHLHPSYLAVTSPSWKIADMFTEEPPVHEACRRMLIAPAEGTITIPWETIVGYANSLGKTVSELGLREITDDGFDDCQPSTSGRRQPSLPVVAERQRSAQLPPIEMDESPLSSPVRRVRNSFGVHTSVCRVGETNRVYTIDSDPEDMSNNSSETLKANDADSEVIDIFGEDISEERPLKFMKVDDFPTHEQGEVLSIDGVRSSLCFKVTKNVPMYKSGIVFVWISANTNAKNVENFIKFYCDNADRLAVSGRFEVQMGEASDWDGPFKECITMMLEAFRHYVLPDTGTPGTPMFEKEGNVTLITSVFIVTKDGQSALKAFGYLLRLAIIHSCPYPNWFNNSAIRYALDLPIDVNDVYLFSPGVRDIIQGILHGTGEIVWGNEAALRYWAEHNPKFPTVALLSQGREKFCQFMAEFELIGKRVFNLKHLLDGLLAGAMAQEFMKVRAEWKFIELCVYRYLTPEDDLLEQFVPYDEEGADPTRVDEEVEMMNWLDDIIKQDLSFNERREFLHFITASYSIPADPLIQVVFTDRRNGGRRPVASTCSNKLTLPTGCPSKEKLLEMVRECIASMGSSMSGLMQLK